MTRKRGRPTADEVRCPECGVVAWRRVGERIDVERAGGERRLVHAFEQGGSHWEWTCARCGYAVRATSVLDNALARVQPTRVPGIIGGLFGAGAGAAAGAESGGAGSGAAASGGLSGLLQAGAAAAAGVAAVAVIAAAATTFGRPTASPAATASASAASPATAVTELAALTDAGPDMTGRRLELDRAEVTRVTGDTTFWLGAAGAETLVVLDEEQQPEHEVTVRAGQEVRISGTLHQAPPEDVALSYEDRRALEEVPVYVVADEVEVVEE